MFVLGHYVLREGKLKDASLRARSVLLERSLGKTASFKEQVTSAYKFGRIFVKYGEFYNSISFASNKETYGVCCVKNSVISDVWLDILTVSFLLFLENTGGSKSTTWRRS